MSNTTVSSSTIAGLISLLPSSVANSQEVITAATRNLSPQSILLGGIDRSRAIADAIDAQDRVMHVPNPLALAGDIHAVTTAKNPEVTITGPLRLLLLPNTRAAVTNAHPTASHKVIISHLGPDQDHKLSAVAWISPGGTQVFR